MSLSTSKSSYRRPAWMHPSSRLAQDNIDDAVLNTALSLKTAEYLKDSVDSFCNKELNNGPDDFTSALAAMLGESPKSQQSEGQLSYEEMQANRQRVDKIREFTSKRAELEGYLQDLQRLRDTAGVVQRQGQVYWKMRQVEETMSELSALMWGVPASITSEARSTTQQTGKRTVSEPLPPPASDQEQGAPENVETRAPTIHSLKEGKSESIHRRREIELMLDAY
ncbi:hypothetical protein QFC21_006986 [Naganishia friedmannii]|uniref:Uncharacterized protein n=2 Tax=Naganishia friedmannii TaxID=89922 RepID=A0ACC2UVZ8_9TREE|nr:hypothetical protein QFC21_007286 [Naganishia friedmannii]KAJ9092120.1 hypothetical protein QFC21_006986 [Naganishia friedmannii]